MSLRLAGAYQTKPNETKPDPGKVVFTNHHSNFLIFVSEISILVNLLPFRGHVNIPHSCVWQKCEVAPRTDLDPVVGVLEVALDGVDGLPHDGHVVRVPLVLVVSGQLQHPDHLIHLLRHSAAQVIAILRRLLQSLSACQKVKQKSL